jgi:carbon starvation protein CstA
VCADIQEERGAFIFLVWSIFGIIFQMLSYLRLVIQACVVSRSKEAFENKEKTHHIHMREIMIKEN